MMLNSLRGKTGLGFGENSGMVVRARAPLRLGLAGGGTDVSPYVDLYGGAVMNVTIDRYIYATIELLDGDEVLLESHDLGLSA